VVQTDPAVGTTPRKQAIERRFDQLAGERERWVARNRYFYEDELTYFRFLVSPGQRVLELGCGTGRLLAALHPAKGIGLDISARMVEEARGRHPHLDFVHGDIEDEKVLEELGGPFDVIIMADTAGYLDDIQATFRALRRLCTPQTRVIFAHYSPGWRPLLRLAEALRLKMPEPESENWLSSDDLVALLELADFEVVKREWRMLVPRRLGGLGTLVNSVFGTLPGLRRLSLRDYVVARMEPERAQNELSTSIIIPARNEAGNIEAAVARMPRFCDDMEIIFVEGNSQDETVAEIQRVIEAHPDWDIKFAKQEGKGKGDAVRRGFDLARGDVLMILDADLTVPPEELPKFYEVIASGRGEFVNGTRLVYPLEKEAMRRLNWLANHLFARLFSWLLNQRFTDTLCGTKVLHRAHYDQIARNRDYFGDFDPFGDYDLIFGASKLNLKVVEVPIRYQARSYGSPQISRFRDGWLLQRMVRFAWRRLKVLG
jgi:SAM-dependent methyltransferase